MSRRGYVITSQDDASRVVETSRRTRQPTGAPDPVLPDGEGAIFKAPAGGVPAQESDSVGTGTDCEMYYISPTGDLTNLKRVDGSNLSTPVFNVLESDIAEDHYFWAANHGREWLATGGGGGGAAKIFKTAAGATGIPARSGGAAGQALCNLYSIATDGTLTDEATTETVNNPFSQDIAADMYIVTTQVDGQNTIVAEDCPPPPPTGPVNPF